MKGMLDPEYEGKVIGQVEIRTTFKVSKIGMIAGSMRRSGKSRVTQRFDSYVMELSFMKEPLTH